MTREAAPGRLTAARLVAYAAPSFATSVAALPMVLFVPAFLVSLWKIFVPGEDASAGYLLGWPAALCLGFTMIDLPHKAWGAELSTD